MEIKRSPRDFDGGERKGVKNVLFLAYILMGKFHWKILKILDTLFALLKTFTNDKLLDLFPLKT